MALRDLRDIAPSLSPVVDVAWRDSEELWCWPGTPTRSGPCPTWWASTGGVLDDVSVSGLPSQPTSVAAAPTRQPLVTADGALWELSGGTWVTLERGAEPRRGSEPFFPL